MGTQTWVLITILSTEALIVLKFDWQTVTKPFPPAVAFAWTIFIAGLILWCVWQFYLKPRLNEQEYEKKSGEKSKKSD